MAQPFPPTATRTLSSAEAQALRVAVAHVMSADEEEYRDPALQADLPNSLTAAWPGWPGLIEGVVRRLAESPHAVLVRGVPVDEAVRALVALSCGLGEVVEPYRQAWSRLVRHIAPPTDRESSVGTLNERLQYRRNRLADTQRNHLPAVRPR